jgi:purine nucleosidase
MSGPLIIDVDTGLDDALALGVLTAREPQLLAVTTVAGNVGIDASTENTLRVLAWLGASEIPVHRGASRPLAAPAVDAAHVHGTNGLGNAELPTSDRSSAEDDAIQAILRLAERYSGELTLVAVGPLTNIAIALSLRPSLVEQVRRLVVMGGAFWAPGNITPHAEFNIYVDPHAANQVFAAQWRELLVLGLDVTHQTVISRRTWGGIGESAPPPAQLARMILRRTFEEREMAGAYLHDPLAALVALDPDLVGFRQGTVVVETDGDESGRTFFTEGEGNVRVASSVNGIAAEQSICEALGIAWVSHDGAAENAE